ncbi:MAG: type II secretion system minor pseudopilin GspI [Pseudomonadota bacterium]
MITPRRSHEGGFTLIEVLVALVILGVGAMSLLLSAQAHAARVGGLEDRTVARWVAENHLAGLRLGEEPSDRTAMRGQDWRVTTRESGTRDPHLWRADIAVARAADDVVLFRLTGFLDRGGEMP